MASNETWYYANQGTSIGPIATDEMQALVQHGVIARETLVWPGAGEWIAAGNSSLASLFVSGAHTPPPLPVASPASPQGPVQQAMRGESRFLIKDKRIRTAVGVFGLIFGVYAVYNGIVQMRAGMGASGSGSTSDAQINFQGCMGVTADAVQCTYQNAGPVTAKLCMDVVVTCDDGRHVASSCSDPIPPGQMSMKLVNNFSPVIQATNSCSTLQYENMKSSSQE